MNRLKEMYQNEIVEAMIKKFGYKNIITARKIRPFLYIFNNEDSITLYLNNNQYDINNPKELENIKGGFSVWMGIGIEAVVVFLSGVLEGITNPSKCG